MPSRISSEKLAYWYFRLNGFMTMENFILHPEQAGSQRTDADLYGVRFPYRSEQDMTDDSRFLKVATKPHFVIAEIKAGECKLNRPWTTQDNKNMQYVLSAIGALQPSSVSKAASDLYDSYAYEDERTKIQLMAVGSTINEVYSRKRPTLVQILFPEMLSFVYQRFHKYLEQKRDFQQWDNAGKYLYGMAGYSETEFIHAVSKEAGLASVQKLC